MGEVVWFCEAWKQASFRADMAQEPENIDAAYDDIDRAIEAEAA